MILLYLRLFFNLICYSGPRQGAFTYNNFLDRLTIKRNDLLLFVVAVLGSQRGV